MRTTSWLRLVLLAFGLAACPNWAQAQDPYMSGDVASPITVSEASFGSVMERLQAVEASLAEGKKDEKKDEWVDTSKEKWTTKFAGRIHMDYTNFMNQNADSFDMFPHGGQGQQDAIEFRRIYLGWEGEGYGIYKYKAELDFADSAAYAGTSATGGATSTTVSAPRLKDMYFGINELPLLHNVQFGHFKIPQSMEVLTSSRFISFVERSLPISAFCPEREMGVASYWVSPGENATVSYGVFFDEFDERLKFRLDDRQGLTAVGRATWTPYYDELSSGRHLLHTGISYKYTDDWDNSRGFSSRPETHLGDAYINTGSMTVRDWNTLGLEGAAVWGPLSVQSEFFYVPINDQSAGGDVNRDFYGAYVFGSWFLTGENRNYKRTSGAFDRVSPLENFWAVPGAGIGSGAWEARARWSYLDLSGTSNALSGMQNDVTLGLTWYWNPNLKWMLDYIHTWNKYTNPNSANFNRHPENDILMVSGRVDF
jgi:phosphate-selective porin OprO/OprP